MLDGLPLYQGAFNGVRFQAPGQKAERSPAD